jgi:putative ABC transport system permease protein
MKDPVSGQRADFHIGPILGSLWRNRTGAVLVALQVAIALGVLVNAIYITTQRVSAMRQPTGMDIDNLFVVSSTGYGRDFDFAATLRADLDALRALPGVVAATPISAIPLSGGGSASGFTNTPKAGENITGATFMVDEQGVETLGVKLISGRAFRAETIEPPRETQSSSFVPEVIISAKLGRQLYGDQNPLGQLVYDGLGQAARVVGVMEMMRGPWVSFDQNDQTMLLPQYPSGPAVFYLVRARPGERDAMMQQAETALSASGRGRVINWVRTLQSFKDRSYTDDRATATFLVTVVVLLTAFSALGIFGLAAFQVNARTKQIGTRRAIGARRSDIVRYFLVENWLITTGGIVVGCCLGLGLGYWLSVEYRMPRLPLFYLVGGTLLIWAVGQAAALRPARRAALVAPAVATRTV